jgi:hypothetical protein
MLDDSFGDLGLGQPFSAAAGQPFVGRRASYQLDPHDARF